MIDQGLIKDLSKGAPIINTPAVEETTPVVLVDEPVTTVEEPVAEAEEPIEEKVAEVAVSNAKIARGVEEGIIKVEDELPANGRENIGVFFGVACVFKPYYEGFEHDGLLPIPITKKRFEKMKEPFQLRIFKRAKKKREKSLKKQKNDK